MLSFEVCAPHEVSVEIEARRAWEQNDALFYKLRAGFRLVASGGVFANILNRIPHLVCDLFNCNKTYNAIFNTISTEYTFAMSLVLTTFDVTFIYHY